MIINPRALEILCRFTRWDIEEGFGHSAVSYADCLSQYIHEYTDNLPIHIPLQAPFGNEPSKVYCDMIVELYHLRRNQ
jgi:hypothetical protein